MTIQLAIDSERLLERFLRYVAVDTTADRQATTYPSSPGQWTLGRLLAEELRASGLSDVEQDSKGLVWGLIPGNQSHDVPVIAFNAHFDTSPETTGAGVKPQVIRNYGGGDIVLPGDRLKVIRVAENPELTKLVGKTLVTTDGTTLLGGDDKAGMAVITELAAMLSQHPEIPHGPIRILFTCDEEIGHGVDHVDLSKLAADVGYTLDGGGAGEIDVETFSADMAAIEFHGVNIHPSIAKGRMVNAIRMAADFVSRLPRKECSPETTDGRQGFLHPFEIRGGVQHATLDVLLRDFETARLGEQADLLRGIASDVQREFSGSRIEVKIVQQYRNLGDGLAKEPRAAALAERAHQNLGLASKRSIIRGGTDGSLLTARGLPTPNLSTGQHNPHSPLEWVCLEEMSQAVAVLVELVQLWSRESKRST
ncbi:MAG: Peptidase [Planctomycetota bacterium]